MAKINIKRNSEDVTVNIFIKKLDGSPLVGLVHDAVGLACYYVRPRRLPTIMYLNWTASDEDHNDGGLGEIDPVNLPGLYRLDLPDDVVATPPPIALPNPTSADTVIVMLHGATDMKPVVLEIQLTEHDIDGVYDAVEALAVEPPPDLEETIRSAVGLNTANLDMQLAEIKMAIDECAKTGEYTARLTEISNRLEAILKALSHQITPVTPKPSPKLA